MANKIIYKLIIAGSLFPMLAACQPSMSNDVSMVNSQCENKLFDLIENTSNETIPKILELKGDCDRSQLYYYVLSRAYFLTNSYDLAELNAYSGLKLDGEYSEDLYHTIFLSKLELKDMISAKQIANELAVKMPESDIGHLFIGTIEAVEGNYLSAIEHLEQVHSPKSLYDAKRELTILYYGQKNFKQSVASFEAASGVNDYIYRDTLACLAAAGSYGIIGNKQAALGVLNKHVALVPESKLNPKVIKWYEVIAQAE